MKKEIWIKQYIDENGYTIITGDCNVCKQFPCKHIEIGFDGIKIKSFPKIKRNKIKAKRKNKI